MKRGELSLVTVAESPGTTERAARRVRVYGAGHIRLHSALRPPGKHVMRRCCASKTNRQESRSAKSLQLNALRLQLRWMKKILVLSKSGSNALEYSCGGSRVNN